MSLRIRPPAEMWKDYRDLVRWCLKAGVEGTVATDNLDDGAVTLAKLAPVATDTLLGRATAGTGAVETIPCTAAGRELLNDATAAAQRTTLGLGTAATQTTGTSGATVPLLNGANTHASVQATLFGIGSATPAGTQAAIPDTTGALLLALEVEVNKLKAVLRTHGQIAP